VANQTDTVGPEFASSELFEAFALVSKHSANIEIDTAATPHRFFEPVGRARANMQVRTSWLTDDSRTSPSRDAQFIVPICFCRTRQMHW